MTLQESERRKYDLQIGDFYKENLPQIDFGRIAAQTAKQVISQKVREAERQRQFREYKDRIGEIVIGTIKRVESHSVTVDLGRAEAIIKKDQLKGEDIRFFLGYSGWETNQLTSELRSNTWILSENMHRKRIIEKVNTSFWKEKMLELGGDYSIWSNAPENPAYN